MSDKDNVFLNINKSFSSENDNNDYFINEENNYMYLNEDNEYSHQLFDNSSMNNSISITSTNSANKKLTYNQLICCLLLDSSYKKSTDYTNE